MSLDSIAALRSQHERGIVVGLKDALGQGTRLDIDMLMRDEPKTFNLFIIAMQQLSDKKMAGEIFGYHQIAGIHGLPKQYWDGVKGKANVESTRVNVQSGYCAHSSVLFPTWHRPYLATLEMYDIAGQYTDPATRSSYQEAAKKFRLPYWDYFRPRGGTVAFPGVIDNGMTAFPYSYGAPEIFTQERVRVRMYPNNEYLTISNPFKQYNFPDQQESPDYYIKEQDWEDLGFDPVDYPRDRTVRYPRPQNIAEGWSGDRAMNAVLNSLRMDSCRLFLTMMEDRTYFKYDDFATQGRTQRPPAKGQTDATRYVWDQASGSLEALHGIFHGLIGGDSLNSASAGGGHMSMPGIAAFDPIFVDRLFAIWQAATAGQADNWFNSPQSKRLADAALLPSRKVRGFAGDDFWNSNQSKTTEEFGYSYRDAIGSREEVLQRLHYLYNWSVPLNQTNPTVKAPPEMEPYNAKSSEFLAINTGVVPPRKAAAEPEAESSFDETAATATGPVAESLIQAAGIHVPQVDAHVEQKPAEGASVAGGNYVREWYIDDRVQRLAVNGTFTIFYFISNHRDGSAPSDDADWALAPTLAGISHIFAAPAEHCDNCGLQQEQQTIVGNTVSITSFLLDYIKIGQLADLEPANVEKFLIARLKWKIQHVNGRVIDPRELAASKDFEVNISCKRSQLPRNSGIATYEEYPRIVAEIIRNASATR